MPDLSDLVPGFCEDPLDRCDDVRGDADKLAACLADRHAQRLMLDGLDPVTDGDRLAREALPVEAGGSDHVFLGREADGAPLFVALNPDLPHGGAYAPRVWEAATLLTGPELSLYATARSLIDWHARHGFCSSCGGATQPVRAGWSRRCVGCGAEHFPRVDPVVIMLTEHDGRVLLGRQPRFPAGRYSALAGFIEPGETVEGAVARELFEEAGVRVVDVRYVQSQPWPFPSSLMIACTATALGDELRVDTQELEDAFWASADDVRAALDGEDGARFVAPPPMAVAHHLLRHWLARQG